MKKKKEKKKTGKLLVPVWSNWRVVEFASMLVYTVVGVVV